MRTTLATAVLLIGAVLNGLPSVAGAQEQKTDSPLTPAELARRMQQRVAVEAVIWGMPAVNYDLMRQEMLDKTAGKMNQVIYWERPLTGTTRR